MTTTRETALSHAVMVSRVVWDSVVAWLAPELSGSDGDGATLPMEHAVGLCVVGEALFPLRGLVRRALVAHTADKWHVALRAAAEAGSASCVDWLVASRRTERASEEKKAMGSVGAERGGERGRGEEMGGDGGAMLARRRRRRRRRENKEFMCVLGAVCGRGEAQRLVGGGWPGLTWESDLIPGVGDGGAGRGSGSDLGDHVRGNPILFGVCERGRVDVAEWLVQRFGFRDPWEFLVPLEAALKGGHLELAQWIVSSFDLVAEKCKKYSSLLGFHSKVCKSGNLEVVKWSCIEGKSLSSVEICNYVSKHIELPLHFDPFECCIGRLDVLKWVMSELPSIDASFPLDKKIVEDLCGKKEALELIKFFVEGNLVVATPALLLRACSNLKDNTELVKWLSTRVSLSQEDIDNSFVAALAHSNTSIASWLEDSHHILERHKEAADSAQLLGRLCERIPCYARRRTAGLKWLLNRLDTKSIPSDQAVDCVGDLLENCESTRAALLLLDKFPMIPKKARSELLTLTLRQTIWDDCLTQVKRIVAMMMDCSNGFTKDEIARCLSSATSAVSSKTVKWLITHFQLEREHIIADNNNILCKLLSWGQECCAEWLINKFNITFDEVLRLSWVSSSLFRFDFATWQMMVEVFSGITATIIKQKYLKLVCHSPVIAHFTLRQFPDVTMEDLLAFGRTYEGYLPLWLPIG
ncbi:hypothetical protein Pelo_649 [Pelomyxa schiedti]|nr:hypothetical protein Pelo_649 [Pelomyxa schiedti]